MVFFYFWFCFFCLFWKPLFLTKLNWLVFWLVFLWHHNGIWFILQVQTVTRWVPVFFRIKIHIRLVFPFRIICHYMTRWKWKRKVLFMSHGSGLLTHSFIIRVLLCRYIVYDVDDDDDDSNNSHGTKNYRRSISLMRSWCSAQARSAS